MDGLPIANGGRNRILPTGNPYQHHHKRVRLRPVVRINPTRRTSGERPYGCSLIVLDLHRGNWQEKAIGRRCPHRGHVQSSLTPECPHSQKPVLAPRGGRFWFKDYAMPLKPTAQQRRARDTSNSAGTQRMFGKKAKTKAEIQTDFDKPLSPRSRTVLPRHRKKPGVSRTGLSGISAR